MEKELAPKDSHIEKKPDLSTIPMDLMKYLARAYEYGWQKYGRDTWRKGFPMHDMVRACREHLKDFWDLGIDYDQEAEDRAGIAMHHLGSVIFNALCLLDAFENHPELDDRRIKPEVHRTLEEQEAYLREKKESECTVKIDNAFNAFAYKVCELTRGNPKLWNDLCKTPSDFSNPVGEEVLKKTQDELLSHVPPGSTIVGMDFAECGKDYSPDTKTTVSVKYKESPPISGSITQNRVPMVTLKTCIGENILKEIVEDYRVKGTGEENEDH